MRRSHIRRTLALGVAVSATALAAGGAVAPKPLDHPSQSGEGRTHVERLAEQYRGRYQLKLGEARKLLAAALPSEHGIDI